jgi:glutamine synthetase
VASTKTEVLKKAHDAKLAFVSLWFTDILGFLKSLVITVDELEKALDEGMGFDGSSIEGFARIEESDMIAKPVASTFQIVPWSIKDNGPTGRMFCDILNPDGSPYDGDPREILKRQLQRAEKMGFTYCVGPELEYFYFKTADPTTQCLDKSGYFDLTPPDAGSSIRHQTVLFLQAMNIPVEYTHHEVAPSQHEIDMRYTDALTMADNVMTCRLAIKEVAQRHGAYATFMPKPLFGQNGSGMHTHQSLFRGTRNAFFNARDQYHLSDLAKKFVAGLLKHSREITAVTNQWVNSYKRLVPGYEAPVYVSWARRNRSTLVRVPGYKPGKEASTRIEYRSPDPACNPYLAFSVMLAAGLQGIEQAYALPEPVEEDIFEMTPQRRSELGIESLPGNLFEALQLAERSDLVREALGEHVFTKFVENRKIEWDRYRIQVSRYELEEYLPIL